MQAEYGVIGGGLVGMAIACGLQRHGVKVAVFAEGDHGLTASRGNFGLIWVQGKGAHFPDYARWTMQSANHWSQFAINLQDETGIDIEHDQRGGLDIYLGEKELDAAANALQKLHDELGGDYPFEVLDHKALQAMEPEIGPQVAGGIYSPLDGHVNPLYLLHALYHSFINHGGVLINDAAVSSITPGGAGFTITNGSDWQVEKLVLAAGLGCARLAPMLGLSMPVTPLRGQIIITEKIEKFLNYPGSLVRQVGEGGVQIGDSHEDTGFDDSATIPVLAAMAKQAVTMFPALTHVNMLRGWGALRIMPPNGLPIYQRSQKHPNAYGVTCHSGVTLAANHAGIVADWIAGKTNDPLLQKFSGLEVECSNM